MNIHLVRHCECFKNLIGIPGGEGTSLTPAGILQAEKVGEALRLRVAPKATLITCPPRQTIETAAIIGRHLEAQLEVESLFTSINLGVLSGVPIKEAEVRFPESSAAMDRWRSQISEIGDLQINGMESPRAFYNRGLQGLLKYKACHDLILCATTSIMILIRHISDKITPEPGKGYKSLDFQNGEILSVVFDDQHLKWLQENLLYNI